MTTILLSKGQRMIELNYFGITDLKLGEQFEYNGDFYEIKTIRHKLFAPKLNQNVKVEHTRIYAKAH